LKRCKPWGEGCLGLAEQFVIKAPIETLLMPRGRRRGGPKQSAAAEAVARSQVVQETLEVDFDFNQLNETDFHAVSLFLKGETWAFIEDLNFGELADCICEQGNIGTVVRTNVEDGAGGGKAGSGQADASAEDDEMIVALTTALNLRQFSGKAWAKAIPKALLAKAKKHAKADIVKSLEGLLAKQGKGEEVGLFISERAVNLPPECVAPLQQAIVDDIEWSCTTPECPEDERPFYFFSHFIGIARCGPPAQAVEDQDSEEERPGKRQRREQPSKAGDELEFANYEDECLAKRALFSFTFPMPAPKGDRAFTHEKRMVYVVTMDAFKAAAKELAGSAKDAAPLCETASPAVEDVAPGPVPKKGKKASKKAKSKAAA